MSRDALQIGLDDNLTIIGDSLRYLRPRCRASVL